MKYLSAYALCVLGGKASPTENDVKKVLNEIGADINETTLKQVVEQLKSKPFHEIINAGLSKVQTIGGGSGGVATSVPAASAPAPAEKKKEEKKEEQKEEEADDFEGAGGLFGEEEEF